MNCTHNEEVIFVNIYSVFYTKTFSLKKLSVIPLHYTKPEQQFRL